MSNALPLVVEMSALPPSVRFTPQQLADAIAQRLRIVTQAQFALFVTGSTEPSSNVGPWLKNGNSWYVWSDVTGNYVPITIEQESLGYVIQEAEPDPNIYQFWIRTNSAGSPLGISIYYSGAWVDVYAAQLASYLTIAAYNASIANYSTTAQMNAAISAAISGIPTTTIVAGQGSFSARPSSNQSVVFGGSGNSAGTVNLGTTDFDPDSAFAGNVFTVPADGYYQFNAALGCSVSAGAPSDADLRAYISFNGGSSESLNDEPISTSLAGRVFTGSVYAYLAATTQVTLRYDFTLDSAGTVTIDASYTRLSGYRVR